MTEVTNVPTVIIIKLCPKITCHASKPTAAKSLDRRLKRMVSVQCVENIRKFQLTEFLVKTQFVSQIRSWIKKENVKLVRKDKWFQVIKSSASLNNVRRMKDLTIPLFNVRDVQNLKYPLVIRKYANKKSAQPEIR